MITRSHILFSYLFDIFLGPSYNTAPPTVKYMTTNGGKFRFNPNLYAVSSLKFVILAHAKSSSAGWKSMPISTWHLVWTRMGFRKIDPAPGQSEPWLKRARTAQIANIQVLISIQSMILCDEPYLNEPGWASGAGTPASNACKFSS
jgi:hypothetical protein